MLFAVPRPLPGTLKPCQGAVLGEHRGLGRFGHFHLSLSQGQRAGGGAPCRARLGGDLRGRFLPRFVGQVGVVLKFCSEGFEISPTFLGEAREHRTAAYRGGNRQFKQSYCFQRETGCTLHLGHQGYADPGENLKAAEEDLFFQKILQRLTNHFGEDKRAENSGKTQEHSMETKQEQSGQGKCLLLPSVTQRWRISLGRIWQTLS